MKRGRKQKTTPTIGWNTLAPALVCGALILAAIAAFAPIGVQPESAKPTPAGSSANVSENEFTLKPGESAQFGNGFLVRLDHAYLCGPKKGIAEITILDRSRNAISTSSFEIFSGSLDFEYGPAKKRISAIQDEYFRFEFRYTLCQEPESKEFEKLALNISELD